MYLGIDIGGTYVRIVAYAATGSTVPLGGRTFLVTGEFEQDYANITNSVKSLQAEIGIAVEGIGLAVAGKVNASRSFLARSPHLPHWERKFAAEWLSQEWSCDVVMGNDVEAAALAEALYGHGQEDDFWFIGWGTGIGGALIRHLGGKAVALAGEPGHQRVTTSDTHICDCTQTGCLEAYCGGRAIERRYQRPAEDLSRRQWEEVLAWMQIGIRNVVTAQPVPLVVFGGGVVCKQQSEWDLLGQLQQQIADELRIVAAPKLLLSRFGESAGTLGAAALLTL